MSENPEQREREDAAKRERARWRELYRMYERCVEISETIWGERLDAAQEVQQGIAERMRDRRRAETYDAPVLRQITSAEIPVPLFTPRDRQQFVKEVAATLLISADRRNLTVLFPKEVFDAPQTPPEAASGTDEMLDREVGGWTKTLT